MKLTVSQKLGLGLLVIHVLCLLMLWAALRKPLEHKKIFAMSSLVVQAKTGLMLRNRASEAFRTH